jgi:DegV family protein with EDD domain
MIEHLLAVMACQTGPTIAVMNTDLASGAAGLVAMEVLCVIQDCQPLQETLKRALCAKRRTGTYLILSTFDYTVDRVGEMRAFLGTLLRIKPVLTLREGYLVDVARARGERTAVARMIEHVKRKAGDATIDAYVLHSFAPVKAQELLKQVLVELPVRHSWVDDIGCSVARYTGRGGLAIAFSEICS